MVTTVHLRTRIMRSTAGGRWAAWELGVVVGSHGRVIHHATPAPLNGDATHTTATRRKAPIRTTRECEPRSTRAHESRSRWCACCAPAARVTGFTQLSNLGGLFTLYSRYVF